MQIINFLVEYRNIIYIILGILFFTLALHTESKTRGIIVAALASILIAIGVIRLITGNISPSYDKDIAKIEAENAQLRDSIAYQKRYTDSLEQEAKLSEQRALDFAKLLTKYKQDINSNKQQLNEKIIRIDSLSSSDINEFFTNYGTRYYQEYINFKN